MSIVTDSVEQEASTALDATPKLEQDKRGEPPAVEAQLPREPSASASQALHTAARQMDKARSVVSHAWSKLFIARAPKENDPKEKASRPFAFVKSPWLTCTLKAGVWIYVLVSVSNIHTLQTSVQEVNATALALNDQLTRQNSDNSVKSLNSTTSQDNIGRPLDRTETPAATAPTPEQRLRDQTEQLAGRIAQLKTDAPEQASLLDLQLRRLQHASKTSLYFFRIEQPAKPVIFPREWCLEQLARLSPIYKRAMAEIEYQKSKDVEQIPRSAFFRATAVDCAKDARLRLNGWYHASGQGSVLERLRPLPNLNSADSIAQTDNDVFYYSVNGKVFKVAGEDASQYQIWCPGSGAARLFYNSSAQELMVLRDKLYLCDANNGTWRVVDSVRLPEAPVTTAPDGDFMVLGRVDNGRVQYIHKYAKTGQLQDTIKLSEQLILPSAASELLFTTDGAEMSLQHTDEKTGSHWLALLHDDGQVLYQGREALAQTIEISKPHPQHE